MPFQIFAIFVVQNHSPILLADGTLVFDHRDNLMHVEGPYCDLLKRKHATPFEDLVKEAANAQPEESISCDHGAIINWRRHDVIWLKPTAVGIPQAHRPKTNVMRA